jgi:preprotein translocase subunit SecA
MNQAELQLHADQKKTELFAQKEMLFFAIDEKSHEADLSEKGRNNLSPQDPTPSCCRTSRRPCTRLDVGRRTDPRKRLEAK